MNIWRGLVLCGAVLALAACSNSKSFSEVNALNNAKAVGSPFTQALASEYRDFANSELNKEYDYPDALHFARKGLAAAAGETVLPEPISDWNLLPEHMNELSTARGRLLVAFDMGAREMAPKEAAVAQVRFDCWIEQQEENWQAKDIRGCKEQFKDAMDKLEGMIKPAEFPAPVEATTAAAAPMKAEDAMYLVFFDWNKYNIGAGAQNVLDAVVTEVKSRQLKGVHIVGHTDTSGPKHYNDRLSTKRAAAVRDYLTSHGVDATLVSTEGHGEDDLLVKTPDNTREPANRRAQITFQ